MQTAVIVVVKINSYYYKVYVSLSVPCTLSDCDHIDS